MTASYTHYIGDCILVLAAIIAILSSFLAFQTGRADTECNRQKFRRLRIVTLIGAALTIVSCISGTVMSERPWFTKSFCILLSLYCISFFAFYILGKKGTV